MLQLYLKRLPVRFDGYSIGVIFLFILFLSPLSFMVRGDNVSANYSFILCPFIFLIMGRTLIRPSNEVLLLGVVYLATFLIPLAYQNNYYDFWERRLISFVLFMSAFAFFVVKINEQMMRCFKVALVSVSVLYCLNSFYTYFSSGGATLGYDLMRPIVQSQRFGFILLAAVWLVFLYKPSSYIQLAFKYLVIFILMNGLGLTFSRSSIAGLLCSSCAYFFIVFAKWLKKPSALLQKNILNLLIALLLSSLVAVLSYLLFPDYFEFFSLRLLKINITPAILQGYVPYPSLPAYDTYVYDELESSEGYRLYMIRQVFTYLSNNPFFGSGFLGVWVMFSDLNGAAHNQLLDVLFRTGIIGFIAYSYLLGRILYNLYKSDEIALLCAVIGTLAIGMFHETFKLSQGSFLFAFLAASSIQGLGLPSFPNASK